MRSPRKVKREKMPEDQALGNPPYRDPAEETVSRDKKGVFSEVGRKPGECDARKAKRKIFKKEERINYIKCC